MGAQKSGDVEKIIHRIPRRRHAGMTGRLHVMKEVERDCSESRGPPGNAPGNFGFPSDSRLHQHAKRESERPKQHSTTEREHGYECEDEADRVLVSDRKIREGGEQGGGEKIVAEEERKLKSPCPVFSLNRRKQEQVNKEEKYQ